MGAEDSIAKLKRKKGSELAQKANKKMKTKTKKKSSVDIANKSETELFELLPNTQDEPHKSSGEKKTGRCSRNIKMKNSKKIRAIAEDIVSPQRDGVEDGSFGEKTVESELAEDKLQKGRKKRKNAKSVKMVDEHNAKDDVCGQGNGKSRKAGKTKKKSRSVENKVSPGNFLESRGEDTKDDVYQMSSGDEDYSKGMQKWITQYHQSRPGVKLLQEKIDDFILAHEAKEEEARVERESQAAEGGWTVVVHHKGRKKTTDAESGIAMGSVAKAAVEDKLANKKTKGVGLDFYRFQKREAHRNEIMMLQSKFEQDKKRIQQLRAERKFRPY